MGFTSEQAREAGKKSSRKGIQDKVSARVIEAMDGFFLEQLTVEKLAEVWEQLTPSEKMRFTLQAMPYYKPKLGSVDLNTTSGDDVVSVWKSWTPEQRLEILGVTNE